ncbi:MAG: cupin domain-containing protein [bacterium]
MGVIHKLRQENGNLHWEGVSIKEYPDDQSKHVTKQEMVGPQDGANHFAMRYFEVAPGGCTSLDVHKHDHGVMILRGNGKVLLGEESYEIGFGDAVYVPPYEKHQFVNTGDEPLGFLCVSPPKE